MCVTRYNRSFVGLMEECNTGDWIKSIEHDACVSNLRDDIAASNDCVEFYRKELGFFEKDYKESLDVLAKNNIAFLFSIGVNVVLGLTIFTELLK